MSRVLIVGIACVGLFIGMVLVSRMGYRFGRRSSNEVDTVPEVSGAIIAAVFALLGLLLAFTFSGAYSRLDARRQLMVQEANAIGTAYLRLDLLPLRAQAVLRDKFHQYTVFRAELYENLMDAEAFAADLAWAEDLEQEIWALAVAASSAPEYQTARLLVMPPINEMIDIITTRTVAIQTHPPLPIILTLFMIALVCAGLVGYRAGASERHNQLYTVLLAAVVSIVIYLILDIEYPRSGLVNLERVNHILFELADKMK